MLRKMVLTALLAAGLVTGLAVTPSADAAPSWPSRHQRAHVHYEVLYRHGNHWDTHGTYHDRDDAERAARHLRLKGYKVRIERNRV